MEYGRITNVIRNFGYSRLYYSYHAKGPLLQNMTETMASDTITLPEFDYLCRLCAAKTSVLLGLHIFEREGDSRQIFKKITACLPVQVNA